jgi:DNA polymerase III delta subunit
VPGKPFSLEALPSFEAAPPVILIAGPVGFFVEDAARRARESLAGDGVEVLHFEADDPPAAITEALLNRSLFSPRRVVALDASPLVGTEAPGDLLEAALEAWERGTPASRREAFRHTRAALAALGIDAGEGPEESAGRAARKLRRTALADALVPILREMPEQPAGGAAIADALRLLLSRGNDGTVALLTAVAPPAGAALLSEIEKEGLVLLAQGDADRRKENAGLLRRLAESRAKEREVSAVADAWTRLMERTDYDPALFAAEVDKLLAWAGPGGRLRAEDVAEQVEDDSSSDLYGFFDALGRRDPADALSRLERLLSGATVRAGEREVDTDDYWEVRLFGMMNDEVRKMLHVRAFLEAQKLPGVSSPREFESRVYPRMVQAAPPLGKSPFASGKPYMWFKVAERASRFTVAELTSAVSRAADVDAALKNSSPPDEVLAAWVARLVRPAGSGL